MKNNVALRYLESLDSVDTSPRYPLQPTSKYNASPIKRGGKDEDLDKLASEMNASPLKKGPSFMSKFGSPSATVSSFRSPKIGPAAAANNGSLDGVAPTRLSPLKRSMDRPSAANTAPASPVSPGASTGPAYEYLCRIQAIKNWLEVILQEEITQSAVELINYIRNGIHLAKLSNLILPTTRRVFTNDSKLQFKHTENINRFFQLLDYMNVPDLFRFELTDLYDAKNVPKVWFCLHALSYTLGKSDPSLPLMENLVGKLEFSDDDIKTASRSLAHTGLPNFASADDEEGESSYFNAALSPGKPEAASLPPRPVLTPAVSKREVPVRAATPSATAAPIDEDNPFLEASPTVPVATLDWMVPSPKSKKEEPARAPSPAPVSPPTPAAAASVSEFSAPVPSSLSDEAANIIKLQALARGSNFRYTMFVDRIMLRSFDEELVQLASVIRGNLSRAKSVHEHRTELLFFKREVIALQSSARRTLLKRRLVTLAPHTSSITSLQSLVRGNLARKDVHQVTRQFTPISDTTSQTIQLQALIRAQPIASRTRKLISIQHEILPSILTLQSCARSCLYRRYQNMNAIKNSTTIRSIIKMQSIIRGNQAQKAMQRKRLHIYKSLTSIHELQSIARGALARTKLCNSVLITLIDEDLAFNELFAKVRGNLVRKDIQHKKRWIEAAAAPVFTPLQSMFRGILVRFEREVKMEDFYQNIDSFIEFQSIIRARRVQRNHSSIDKYYNANVKQVIRAQAIIKSQFAQRAYKGLISMKSPPLSVIKRFAYLLTDNDIDYQEEMKLAELKDQIINLAKSNEEIEQSIENLDIKLSLLDRNKISVEEFVKHKRYKSFSPVGGSGSGSSLVNDKALEKSSRERLELYSKLFYLLQTNVHYLTRGQVSNEAGASQGLSPALVSNSLYPIKDSSIEHHSREEYFLVKLTLSLMQQDMEHHCKNISDITKQPKTRWIDYFLQLNNHTYQRQHLKTILGKLTTDLVDDDYVDFESNPCEIYNRIRDKREGRVSSGGVSEGADASITPQVAIKDPEVSAKFVENLMALREFATECLDVIASNTFRVPLHVKVIARNAYDLSKLQFPEKLESQHLAVAGVIFAKHYIGAILICPENYGLINSHLGYNTSYSLRARENLKHLNRVLLQAFSLKPFNDNFLKPLNEYLTTCFDSTSSIIKNIINVADVETEYDMNQYDDVIAHEKPQLTLKVHDMIQISKFVRDSIDSLAPTQDDPLHSVVNKLHSDSLSDTSTKDLIALAELGGLVTLNLSPTTQEESISDSKTKVLFAQAKRSLMYIIRIQDGPGLLELLISGISAEHEAKFREIVSQERSNNTLADQSKRPYYKTSLGDLSSLTYRDLKRMALEIILKLEHDHKLTRKNSYQDLLNEIAIDIKTKHSLRISRKQQLEIASASQRKLSQKASFLHHQLADYNKHVEQVLTQLQQSKKNGKEKKFLSILPVFSKQYFYQRELRKSNRLPKFGSYKYSAKKLLDQGIIKDFNGKQFASSSKLDFMFSCNEVGKFTIEVASGSVSVPGAINMVTLDEFLNLQYEGKRTFDLFDGMVSFDTHNLMAFIFRKFYHTQQ